MPSAAKKRKAAKKKREKEAVINSATNSPPRGSDGGEVGSSAYNDQDDHYHSVTEGSEEVEERDPPAAQPSVAHIKSMEEVPSDSKNVNVEEYGNKKSSDNNVNDESLSEKNSKYEPNNSIQKDESLSEVAQVGAVDVAVNVTTSSLEEPKPKEYDGKEHIKDCESPECSENQPLMASVPPLVQKTSWLSCCGIFEVLSGSNR